VVTNATGDFVVPNVTAGTYTVEVSMPGFRTLKRAGIAVSGGDRVGLGELTLAIGGAAETVTVTTEAPIIQSQSGERSFRITTTEVSAIAEVNVDKFGSYTPGTNIPIVSEAEARAMKPDYFLVLPWHFKEGIVQREAEFLAGGGRMIFPFPEIEIV
jgi:hypothetical protein